MNGCLFLIMIAFGIALMYCGEIIGTQPIKTVFYIGGILLIVLAFAIAGGVFEKSNEREKWLPRLNPSNKYTYPNYPEDWPRIRQEVLSRDGHRCGNCGSNHNLMVHHIVPLSKGGSNSLSNLRTLCEDCHKKLHPHMRD